MKELNIKISKNETLEMKDGKIVVYTKPSGLMNAIKNFFRRLFGKPELEPEHVSYKASELVYFYPFASSRFFPKLNPFGKTWAVFGDIRKGSELKMSTQDAKDLQANIEECQPPYMRADLTTERENKGKLWAMPDLIVHVHRLTRREFTIVRLSMADVAFFNICGTWTKKLYFGYLDQIELPAPNKQFAEDLLKYIKAHDSKLGKAGSEVFNSSMRLSRIFNPSYWFTKESITFSDEAMLYHRKTLRTQDTMYIPYDKIAVVLPSSGWFRKRICVYGDMHVNTKQPFSRAVAQKIMDKVREHGVKSMAEGAEYGPSKLWFRWLYTWMLRDVKVIVADQLIYVNPGRSGGLYRSLGRGNEEFTFNDTFDGKLCKDFQVVRRDAIVYRQFRKEHWWHIHGCAYLGIRETSIRKDQTDMGRGYIKIEHIRKGQANSLLDATR